VGERTTASDAIAIYLQLWRAVYSLGLGPVVPLTMRSDETSVNQTTLLEFTRQNKVVQVCGPSGCGKSHLLLHLTLTMPENGYVPVFVRAADFNGDLEALLDRAVSTVAPLDFQGLVEACRNGSRRPAIIVDAINECPSNQQLQLIAAVQKLRTQLECPMLISGQSPTALPTVLSGPVVKISAPDMAQKRELVEAHLGRAIPDDLKLPLDIISSAMDAMIWAEVVANSDVATSRFALYDAYVRRRLAGSLVGLAQRALASLAYEMRQGFAFSMPKAAAQRVIDRVVPPERTDEVRSSIERSGLFPTNQGRSAFKHELLMEFFATIEMLRITPQPHDLGRALSKPLNQTLSEFAIGALPNGMEVAATLSGLRSVNLLASCLSGLCGPAAQGYVEGECAAALARLRERFCAVKFDLKPGSDRELSSDASQAAPFRPEDGPYLAAAMMIFPDGRMVRQVLDAIGRIDGHIERERSRLRAGYPDKKNAWRARMFTALYALPDNRDLDQFRLALQTARMGSLWRDAKDTFDRIASLLAGYETLTPGQLYFLIEGFHAAYTRDGPPPEFLYRLAERAFSFGIYHLRLATTHMLTMHCHGLSQSERERLIALAESWLDDSNPLMNSCVIDVLKVLGALDDQFSDQEATAEYERAVTQTDSQEANEWAFSLYGRMFDHPFGAAYARAFYDLPDATRQALLARAVKTTDTNSMFFSFLLSEIATNPTAAFVPALQQVAYYPNANTVSIQESMSTFVSSISSLAKIAAPLPPDKDERDAPHRGWQCIRHILYVLHTSGITQAEYQRRSEEHWRFLESERLIDHPMRIVSDRWRDRDETSARLLEWSKEYLLTMSREFLARAEPARSWFANPHDEKERFLQQTQFALSVLGMYGDRSDLPSVVALIDDDALGLPAMKAARGIESR
jgi:energy-coupling factor transporter ATP-binding protein EcfA2